VTPERLKKLRREAARPVLAIVKSSELRELVAAAERLEMATIGNVSDRERIAALETRQQQLLAELGTARADIAERDRRIADLAAQLANRADRITELSAELATSTRPPTSTASTVRAIECRAVAELHAELTRVERDRDAATASLRDRDDKLAELLVRMLWLYPGYTVKTRGPSGCIMDALDIVAPEVAAEIRSGDVEVDDTYAKHWSDRD
jgi:chromosome segregation ATPase